MRTKRIIGYCIRGFYLSILLLFLPFAALMGWIRGQAENVKK